jgi:hypothetical protein
MIKQVKKVMIMIFVLQVGVNKMVLNFGVLEIHGVLIGANMVILD